MESQANGMHSKAKTPPTNPNIELLFPKLKAVKATISKIKKVTID